MRTRLFSYAKFLFFIWNLQTSVGGEGESGEPIDGARIDLTMEKGGDLGGGAVEPAKRQQNEEVSQTTLAAWSSSGAHGCIVTLSPSSVALQWMDTQVRCMQHMQVQWCHSPHPQLFFLFNEASHRTPQKPFSRDCGADRSLCLRQIPTSPLVSDHVASRLVTEISRRRVEE